MRTRSEDLLILLAVVDTGGFSAAAQVLDVQVAKVSRAVARVEGQLGVSLFSRTTRRVNVTEEGRSFFESIRSGLSAIERAEESLLTKEDKPSGRLRVDAASPFILHQLVPLVGDFNAAYPDIDLELSSNEGFADLLENRTDVAIRIGRLDDSTLHARPLGRSPLFIVASPGYLAERGAPQAVSELHQHRLIGFIGAKTLNRWPLKGVDDISPSLSAGNGEAVRQLVLAGNGIACLSGFMVRRDIESGELVPLLESVRQPHTERETINAVYYSSSAVSRRVTAFVDFIQPRFKL